MADRRNNIECQQRHSACLVCFRWRLSFIQTRYDDINQTNGRGRSRRCLGESSSRVTTDRCSRPLTSHGRRREVSRRVGTTPGPHRTTHSEPEVRAPYLAGYASISIVVLCWLNWNQGLSSRGILSCIGPTLGFNFNNKWPFVPNDSRARCCCCLNKFILVILQTYTLRKGYYYCKPVAWSMISGACSSLLRCQW